MHANRISYVRSLSELDSPLDSSIQLIKVPVASWVRLPRAREAAELPKKILKAAIVQIKAEDFNGTAQFLREPFLNHHIAEKDLAVAIHLFKRRLIPILTNNVIFGRFHAAQMWRYLLRLV